MWEAACRRWSLRLLVWLGSLFLCASISVVVVFCFVFAKHGALKLEGNHRSISGSTVIVTISSSSSNVYFSKRSTLVLGKHKSATTQYVLHVCAHEGVDTHAAAADRPTDPL